VIRFAWRTAQAKACYRSLAQIIVRSYAFVSGPRRSRPAGHLEFVRRWEMWKALLVKREEVGNPFSGGKKRPC
jgi:hypothetical protein